MSTLPIPKQALIDIVIFFLVCIPVLVVLAMGEPVVTGFWCRDQSLRYPYKEDSVPQTMLVLACFGGPFLVMLMTESIRAAAKTRRPKRFGIEMLSMLKAYGVFMFGLAANVMLTDCLKFSVGRHRPHFINLCKPDFSKINCTVDGMDVDRFVTQYECTNTEVDHKLLRDSRLSFPSGHASLSVYSAIFTIFYLQLRMHVSFSHLLRPTIQLGMLILAVLCCVTRINDHKHFASDVIAGAFIGTAVAGLAFYKLGRKVIPNAEAESNNNNTSPRSRLPRSMSMDSEPHTPTPLLRPERLNLSHSNHNFRNGTGGNMFKSDIVNNV